MRYPMINGSYSSCEKLDLMSTKSKKNAKITTPYFTIILYLFIFLVENGA